MDSESEAGPLALLEAIAAGCTCLVSNIIPNTALITNGENGFHFRSGDSDDLATKLIELHRDQSLRERLAQIAFTSVEPNYDIFIVTQRYVHLYVSITLADT